MGGKKKILFEVLDVCNLLCRLLVRCYVISFVFAGLIFLGGKENCEYVWGLGKAETVTGIIRAIGVAGGFVTYLIWILSGMLESETTLWKGFFLGITFLLFMFFPLSGTAFVGIVVLWFIFFFIRVISEDLGKVQERREQP